jgi:hypothetical protein
MTTPRRVYAALAVVLIWASSVIVPLVVAFLGYLAMKHKR